MKYSAASKSLIIKISLTFLAIFVFFYVAILQPVTLYDKSIMHCSSRECIVKKVEEIFMKKQTQKELEVPVTFSRALIRGARDVKIGLINMGHDAVHDWGTIGKPVEVDFQRVSDNLEWKDLFPEWTDDDEEEKSCPEIPMPDFSLHGGEEMDVVVARVPCRKKAETNRDVFRLQVHLVAGNLAAKRGRRDGDGKVRVVVESECRPMMEIFGCDDLVGKEGKWWMFEVDGEGLEEKMALPIGSCKLALPLWQQGENEENLSMKKKEAYATVLHSSDLYVCGAIVLAQSILKSGSTRDLVLLHDASIPQPKLAALSAAGWKLRPITRIRNPFAKKYSYNEYNYSKLRLWQLTEYRKIVFVDADIVVLRNLDSLFRFPQISAVRNENDGLIFNSGVMVIEPSSCTFKILEKRTEDVVPYNGGDQGFLNEVFVWWHRMPERVNFLKIFRPNQTGEAAAVKNYLFGSDPPKLFAIHYLGLKPWVCHREYDCNWNVGGHRIFASDVAHERWWKVFDEMGGELKGFCALSEERKVKLENDRKSAEKLGIGGGHWKIKTD